VITPVLTRAYLNKEAASNEELKVKFNRGSLVRRAGLEREFEQSEVKIERVPRAIEEAVKEPHVFQVLKGASSSYWPKTS